MRRFFAALRLKWTTLNGRNGPAVPYSISCACGRMCQGVRGARHQVLRCPGCGEMVFILPRSPLPPTGDEDDAPPGGRPIPAPVRSPWAIPLTAGGATLVIVIVGLMIFFSKMGGPSERDGDKGDQQDGRTPEEKKEAGRKLLAEGGFHKALRLLQEARDAGLKDRDLIQLHRQAQLLAQLLPLPLQDIIQNAQQNRSPEEWQAQFRKDHKGRTILFDDVVRRDGGGEHSLMVGEVIVAEEKARVRLNLTLLSRLPLDQPRRLVFGARLANVARGPGGQWVIEFEPDSGVLLTDEGAVQALGLSPLDTELKDVLRDQGEWAKRLP